ncbi:MAG TPA: metallophosphoesterase [Actinomycetes bacterium]|nr:metallophosphoesterase [Actinomycetes bacterium]
MRVRGSVAAALTGCLLAAGCSHATPQAQPTTSASRPSPTSASPQASKPVVERGSLVAVGDIACDPTSPYFEGHPGYCEQEAVARRVGKLVDDGAQWFLPLGDIQYEVGSYSAFMQVYDRSFGEFMDITEPVPGNHEYYTDNAAGYFKYFGERAGTPEKPWRSFSPIDGWQILLLDSNCEYVGGCGPDSPQGRWITKTLGESTADCVVATWHHPLQTSGEYYGNADTLADAKPLWTLVAKGGGDLVLNGHDHIYERFKKLDGVQQFTVGTGGKNPYHVTTRAPGSEKVITDRYGVLQLNMDSRGTYSFEFIATNGDVLDKGSGQCTNQPQ